MENLEVKPVNETEVGGSLAEMETNNLPVETNKHNTWKYVAGGIAAVAVTAGVAALVKVIYKKSKAKKAAKAEVTETEVTEKTE